MASKAAIVEELMAQAGKTSPEVRHRMEVIVGEITIDLFSQNDGMFFCLEKSQNITTTAGDNIYKLNADFNTAKPDFIKVDSAGNFIDKVDVVTASEFFIRQAEPDRYPGNTYARIEYLDNQPQGLGQYLIFGAAPTETEYYKFFYYRKPTANDTGLIRNEAAIKAGIRARMPDLFPTAQVDAVIYEKMKMGFRDSVQTRATEVVLRPSPRVRRLNEMMHRIGRGD